MLRIRRTDDLARPAQAGAMRVHFDPDASYLHVVYGQGLRARVAAQPAAWVAAACVAANRGLTADEVALLDTDRPGGSACPAP